MQIERENHKMQITKSRSEIEDLTNQIELMHQRWNDENKQKDKGISETERVIADLNHSLSQMQSDFGAKLATEKENHRLTSEKCEKQMREREVEREKNAILIDSLKAQIEQILSDSDKSGSELQAQGIQIEI